MTLDEPTLLRLIHGCEQRRAVMRDALAEDESALTGLLDICCHMANHPNAINRLSRKTRRLIAREVGNYAALAIAESIAAHRARQAATEDRA